MRKLFTVLLLGAAVGLHAQEKKQLAKPNYNLAAKFSPEKLKKIIFSTEVQPNWINHTDKFWYSYATSAGTLWYLVDPSTKKKKLLFDNERLAAQITRIVRNPFDAQHLDLQNLRFTDDEQKIRFEVQSTLDSLKTLEERALLKNKADTMTKKLYFLEYDVLKQSLSERIDGAKEKKILPWASFSPDTSKIIYAKNYNLYWMDKSNYEKLLKNEKDSTIVEHALTHDGTQYYAWGGQEYSTTNVDEKDKETKNKRKAVRIAWSPDGQHFVLSRKDNRALSPLWVIDNVSKSRPVLETYKYLMPGEVDSTEEELHIFQAQDFTAKRVNVAAFKNQGLSLWTKDRTKASYKGKYLINYWLGDNSGFYMARSSRDLKRIDVLFVQTSGAVQTLVEERSNVYLDIQKPTLINQGNEFIHWSQRDGWGHYYKYTKQGKLVSQLTSGAFNCVEILGVNESLNTLIITANGREQGEDPYYAHQYALALDGSGLKLLNSGNYDYQAQASPSGRFFVSNASRVNTAPVSSLYNSQGQMLLKLAETDLMQLFAQGYQFPEPFKVKAGDGITDLYGVIYRPFDFDSTKTYPLIEYVYPGPQTEVVNKSFGKSMDRLDRLAQMGFIVVTVGNRGGHPARSKWYHSYGYGNLRDYGLEDKKVAAEQLAARYSYIDLDRVGIFGHSGGGFMSTAAMLVYPDFFKVAVSSAGNHENNIYNRWWSERHHGVQEKVSSKGDTTFSYAIDHNSSLAKNLKGKLLIATGDVDNNVHPANSIRMAEALIKANKRFDFVLLPGQRHAFGNMTEYFFWKTADYFAQHLLGESKIDQADMTEINREIPQNK